MASGKRPFIAGENQGRAMLTENIESLFSLDNQVPIVYEKQRIAVVSRRGHEGISYLFSGS